MPFRPHALHNLVGGAQPEGAICHQTVIAWQNFWERAYALQPGGGCRQAPEAF